MPVYEYQCQDCGNRFEKLFLSISQTAQTPPCPACESIKVSRLLSTPAVHSSGGDSGGEETYSSEPARPPVFGRKELNEAMQNKARLRDET